MEDQGSLPPPLTQRQTNRESAAHNNAVRACIAWLHRHAATMNDPHARAVLNSAAFSLGVDKPNPAPLSPAEFIARCHAEAADGPGAARELARKIVQNDDGSWTIADADIVLLVRMCSALGTAGPVLVQLMRQHPHQA